ncbi:MAG: hypothetical protein V2J25_17435 [Desulfatiglans sp.]|jgi:hypothetical protein|nr:hypothetical protein [Desulfatiglans sp.]
MKYLSKEFVEAVKGASVKDRTWRETARGFSARWQTLLTDCPGGIDKLLEWEVRKTEIIHASLEERPAPSEWRTLPVDEKNFLCRLVCLYWEHTRLHKQEFSAMVAIGLGVYDILGDLTETMKRIESFDAFIDLLSTVPAEYE